MSIHPDNDTRAIAAERDRLKALNADLLAALRALTDWGRTHTSPLDPSGPHELLIDACAAIAKARGET